MSDVNDGLHPVHAELLNPNSGSASPPPGAPPLPLPSITPVFVGNKLVSGPPDSSGGGYRFSPEQLDDIIDQWRDLRDDLRNDEHIAHRLGSTTKPPGNEFASGDFITRGVNSTLEAFANKNRQLIAYVEQYIEKLEKAKKAISETEDSAAEAATQAGSGLA